MNNISLFTKKSTLLLLLLGLSSAVLAQETKKEEQINKQVEVVKSYSPVIGKAIKFNIDPIMEPTMRLEAPVFDYSIAYKPQPYLPKINTLESFDITNFENRNPHNGYLKVGLGYPFQTGLSGFYNTNPKNNLYAAVGLAHNGFWGNLKNDMGESNSALETQNRLSGLLKYQKNRFAVETALGFSYDMFNLYGYYLPEPQTDFVYEKQRNGFMNLDFDVAIGSDFGRNNHWDGRFYTNANYLSDNHDWREADILLGGLLSKGFGRGAHRIFLAVEYQLVSPSLKEEIHSGIARKYDGMAIAPSYRFNSEKFEISAGIKYQHLFASPFDFVEEDRSVVLPEFEFKYKTKRFSPFAAIRSDYRYNGYATLSALNPYIIPGTSALNSYNMDFIVGFNGTAATWLNYSLSGGYRRADNVVMFKNAGIGNTFSVLSGDFDNFIFDAGFSVFMIDKLAINGKYSYVHYKSRQASIEKAYGLPSHTLELSALYHITPKWSARVSGRLESSRTFIGDYEVVGGHSFQNVENNIPSTFDLGIGVGYNLSKRVALSLDFGNLLNQKLYRYNHYRGIGINGMIGASIKF